MTKNIFLAMDSDEPGKRAMHKINSLFLDNKTIAKYIDFSPAKDPDEFLLRFGRLELIKRIEEAPTFLDWSSDQLISQSPSKTSDQKISLLNQLFELVAPLKRDLFATEFLLSKARSLGLTSTNEDIMHAYDQFLSQQKTPISPPAAPSVQDNPLIFEENHSEVELPEVSLEVPPPSKSEMTVLKTLLTHSECFSKSKQITEILDFVYHSEVQSIILWLKEIYKEIDVTELSFFVQQKMEEGFSKEVKQTVLSSVFQENKAVLDDHLQKKMLNDLRWKLQINKLKRQREELKQKRKQCSSDQEGLKLLELQQEIDKQLLELNKNH